MLASIVWDVDPTIFEIAGRQIRWYGLMWGLGFILAYKYAEWLFKKENYPEEWVDKLFMYSLISVVVGARLGHCLFYQWDYYSQHLDEIFKIWEGGLAIYGGIIGGLLAAFIVCKVEKINFYNLLDMAGISLLIGQGIGRWGNYANQEAFGGFTYSNFGMMSDKVVDYIQRHPESFGLEGVSDIPSYIAENDLYVHPTFFYESVWCLLGFVVLYIIMKKLLLKIIKSLNF